MKLSEDLVWRGLIKDRTFEDLAWLDEPKTFYLGADCNSADSLTIGNLAIFMVARRLLEAGWNTVLLVGGATSLIGDPGGKDEERPLKSQAEINANVAGIKKQVQQLFANKEFTLVNNYDWFQGMGYLEFLREVGKHYSMSELTQREFIAERMREGGSGISYAEFSYTLIQGYDFLHLFRQQGVTLQIGGSDQWGNMISGVPLIRKKENAEAHAFSMPLVINSATGKKFGKSEAGAVWLDPAKTSPYQFYQFWLNVDDEGVGTYLKIYTLLSKDEIEDIMARHREKPELRQAQRALADEVTRLVHGDDSLESVKTVNEIIFGTGDLNSSSSESLNILRQELPGIEVTAEELSSREVAEMLVELNLASSKREAREFIASGAIRVNQQPLPRETTHLDAGTAINSVILVRRGKNKVGLLTLK